MRQPRNPPDYMDREARGAKSPVTMSRRRASMEGGMVGHGMSASYQPAEK